MPTLQLWSALKKRVTISRTIQLYTVENISVMLLISSGLKGYRLGRIWKLSTFPQKISQKNNNNKLVNHSTVLRKYIKHGRQGFTTFWRRELKIGRAMQRNIFVELWPSARTSARSASYYEDPIKSYIILKVAWGSWSIETAVHVGCTWIYLCVRLFTQL